MIAESGVSMRISDILRGKGHSVLTVRPDATIRQLLAVLAEHNIGASVVSEDGATIGGIVSERDVSSIMTADVRTCTPETLVEDLRSTMTDHRIRHVPVVSDGKLVGLVSIGDVVKSTISELETEREHLVGYIQS
jgi:CBS domain-containing protein